MYVGNALVPGSSALVGHFRSLPDFFPSPFQKKTPPDRRLPSQCFSPAMCINLMLGPVTLRWTSIPIQGVIELLQVASRYTNLVSSDLIGHLAPMQAQMLCLV